MQALRWLWWKTHMARAIDFEKDVCRQHMPPQTATRPDLAAIKHYVLRDASQTLIQCGGESWLATHLPRWVGG